jgi:hypothetical protein
MTTATKARKPRPKPERRVHLYDGFPMLLEMTIGPLSYSYWLTPIPADFGLGFEVRKLIGDGGDVYHAHIDTEAGHHSCTCKGGTYHGHCKHVESIVALIRSGKISVPAPQRPAAAVPVQFDDP